MIAGQKARGHGLPYGVRSMCSPLRRVLVRRPATAGDFVAAGWRPPDPALLMAQHEAFCELLAGLGCEVEVAAAVEGMVDGTYIRDPGLVTQRGGVVFQMAKPARQDEPGHLGTALEAAGVPVVVRATLPGRCRREATPVLVYAVPPKAGEHGDHGVVIRIYARKIPRGSHVAIAVLKPYVLPVKVRVRVAQPRNPRSKVTTAQAAPRVAMVTREGLCVSPSR